VTAPLPSSIRVLERGWLSANTILLADGEEVAAVDSGYVTDADETVRRVREALAGRRLTRLLNTHSHSDHIGGNAALVRAFACSVTVPAGMAGAVADWDEAALLLTTADQRGERFAAHATLRAGDRFVAGGLAWEAIAAPGHDMDALVFYAADRRLLISGDALWRHGFGILFADVIGAGGGLEAARETLESLARLPIDCVIPGHGTPFVEVDQAFESAFARLQAFEQDGSRMARNALRGCMTFTLLERGRLVLDTLPAYLASVPLYREANARYLQQSPDSLATWLVDALVQAGVARRDGDCLVPVAVA